MVRPILINGKFVKAKSNTAIDVHNPATLESLDSVPSCGEADINAAVEAARAAQKSWWRLSGVEKAELMHGVAERIREKSKAIATTMTQETGKPLIESIDCVKWVAEAFDFFAEVGRYAQGHTVAPGAEHQVNFVRKEPYGVVACISPFNFPLLLMAWKVAPAIAAGNTVVCKPPHQNPLAGLLMGEVYDGLPAGVVNIVTGAADTGSMLLNHPGIDMIAFTGSTAVGKKIAASAGAQLKKVNLELGGIDPLLVFDDADLDVAVPGAVWARLLNAGQVCTSSKRIYVVESVAEEFTKRVVEQVKTLNIGNPMDPKTDMGPLISADAVDKLEQQLATVIGEGAKLLYGGKRYQPGGLKGHFFQPTVVSGVKHGGIATTEELFGPVISIFYVKDANEAIEKANDSEYGLGATVFTKSLELAMKAMENIKAGSFWINDPLADNNAAPFGGMRHSGIGRELGAEGLDAFREPKHVHLDYVQERKPDWFPYAKRSDSFLVVIDSGHHRAALEAAALGHARLFAGGDELAGHLETTLGEGGGTSCQRLGLAYDAHVVLHVLVRPAARMGDVGKLWKQKAELAEKAEHLAGHLLDVVLAADDDEAGHLVHDELLFFGGNVDLYAVQPFDHLEIERRCGAPTDRGRDDDRVGPVHEHLIHLVELVIWIHLRDRAGPSAGTQTFREIALAVPKLQILQAD